MRRIFMAGVGETLTFAVEGSQRRNKRLFYPKFPSINNTIR